MSFETQNSQQGRNGVVDPTHTSKATLGTMDVVALAVGAFMMLMPLAITAYSNPYNAPVSVAKSTSQR